MVIYDAYVNEFIKKCETPRELIGEIKINMLNKFGLRVAENEERSWMNSLPRVANLLMKQEEDYRRVLIEFNVPTSKKRIDFIILGTNREGKPSAWILELKQWSEVTEVEWNTFRVGRYRDTHPSDQAADYKFRLQHEMGMENKIDMEASAYLHNLESDDSPLLTDKYKDMLDRAKLFYALNEYELAEAMDEKTIIRKSDAAFELFKGAKWMPTEKFQDIVRKDFQSIRLVGSQKVIYEKICHFLKRWDKEEKMTFIISGDPGSGKTVIAFKILNWIVSELKAKMQMMLPGQEVRKAFQDSLSNHILSQNISGSNVWNNYDMAIIDEGHKAIGRDVGYINYERNFEQLKFAIVLIDDDQVINRKGITKDEVIEIAEEKGHIVREYNIDENFRNSGERVLLDWIDHVFYGRSTTSGDIEYEQIKYINDSQVFKLYGYKSAKEFTDSYFKIAEDDHSTRLASLWTAGYYMGPADENGLPGPTFHIGDEAFTWNPNEEWLKAIAKNNSEWVATYDKKLIKYAGDRKQFLIGKPNPRFVAYFNHVQGYEFHNMFVYIPNVFTYENGEIIFHRDKLAKEVQTSQTWSPTSKSKSLKGRDPYTLNKKYFLNRVKVLLTRGTKSTHVFAEDENLNKYINEKID